MSVEVWQAWRAFGEWGTATKIFFFFEFKYLPPALSVCTDLFRFLCSLSPWGPLGSGEEARTSLRVHWDSKYASFLVLLDTRAQVTPGNPSKFPKQEPFSYGALLVNHHRGINVFKCQDLAIHLQGLPLGCPSCSCFPPDMTPRHLQQAQVLDLLVEHAKWTPGTPLPPVRMVNSPQHHR